MATTYKIHPAIGIARVGNSPDEFFIGPERPREQPGPVGGFKDAQCRVKRQAARFRIFAHRDDGSFEEVTAAQASITWTVHLVNKKAAHPGRNNTEPAADLTIDPGPRSLTGANQRAAFDSGQIHFADAPETPVPLGEIQTDAEGRLQVLGGFGHSASPGGTLISSFWGNEDWFDDVSDGPVTASITLQDGSTPAVLGAWVICTPPKFAPHNENVITLYDRLSHVMITAGKLPAPTQTSYTFDVQPILQRARDTRWVRNVGMHHSWADPVVDPGLRNLIFSRLSPPGGNADMPDLNESGSLDGRLTPTQYAHMQRWKDGNFINDWDGPIGPDAAITPTGMDRAALEACVGGAFFPGIEAGGLNDAQRPILHDANYQEPFRLNHALVQPGDMTFNMALPWQADFYACDVNWWPVPRPNEVFPEGETAYKDWDRGLNGYADMVAKWHELGFVVRRGNQHVEVGRCESASVQLRTPLLSFQDVAQGPLGMVREAALAIELEVVSPSAAVTLEYAPGGAPSHPQLTAYNTSVTVGPTSGAAAAVAQLWLIFKTGAAGSALPAQQLVVRQQGSSQQWAVTVLGNTIARRTTATALVLDRSLSMHKQLSSGVTRHAALQTAASSFVELALPGDGVGVVAFHDDAEVLQPVVPLGDGGAADAQRQATLEVLHGPGLDPAGQTSIGDGVFEARAIVNGAADAYDKQALIVVADGVESKPRLLREVAPDVDERVFAIGLGRPQNLSVDALSTLAHNNAGYLLVTGTIDAPHRFLLQEYLLQLRAALAGAEPVAQQKGQLIAGHVQRIPFQLTRADAGVDVILLTSRPAAVDFRLQTPTGQIIEPWRARAEPGMRFVQGRALAYYRLVLPTELQPNRFDHGGTWNVIVTIGKPRLEPSGGEQGVDRALLRNLMRIQPAQHGSARRTSQAAQRVARAQLDALSEAATSAASAQPAALAAIGKQPLPYALIVQAYSSLQLAADVAQASTTPGARVDVSASLTQHGIALPRGANVSLSIERPDASTQTLALTEQEPGRFRTGFDTGGAGVYRLRLLARGQTGSGEVFTRERQLTAAVWRAAQPTAAGQDPEAQ